MVALLVACAFANGEAKAAMEDIIDEGWKDEAMGGVKKMMTVMEVVRLDTNL
jgi:hypothetical protein